ncbi:GNAT family N-acetyltransferase [Aneurinibacillus sp. BA2021]|nr:GNAT family N-acetyltransferase [Aneurinibacillus sp. BA2021]
MNPVLLDIPTEFYTERLLIRMPLPGDGKAVYEAIQASMTELKPWMVFVQREPSEQEIEASIREAHAAFVKREDLRLLVFLRDTGEFVASSGLHRIDWNIPKFEIGYWMDVRYSGQGYMTEAVERIAAFAFDTLHARRVEIRCDATNVKSRAIPERLGFTLEGILRNGALSVDGKEVRDTCIFARIT